MANSNDLISSMSKLFKQAYPNGLGSFQLPSEERCWTVNITELESYYKEFRLPYMKNILKIRKSKLNRYLDGGE